ncbi:MULTISPECIES: NADH-quinone oxidoreductase subunit L [unclassified Lentimonas]|uniref:NADH-quinone oxidoreductase subunit L n=1 Tax=unclassified Lentimonas TaxID=2630993 RepID=UPI00132567E2|nr:MULTISPECIES: NADH-quinone oxidoreductase subunit L [unclassified Lentimonas]CAA6679009.1 NADH-ubiquinone oxidoreductase chain L (EC [Lentimonas sp. CC4]CAA6684250.1 NADH-ubiquinone oxidoreductase chain L (EC [Lentimonas sp. CC6]CAA7076376.1 NADH-ubiquinone oxidoreductase chain L (EC [Lentimonas sp. CC4]CAA7170955.1 NADH-ubiquinone oxidoreductase chain L (EC [Lentimonas sp. CC21]CAA7183494.1 NADH-ubiquinone oxidoreductase chain L (EC [Lentimonas sp. CC8]
MDATQILLAALLTPLLSAVLIACFLRRRGVIASYLSVAAAAAICAFSFMAINAMGEEPIRAAVDWLHFGNFTASMGFLFDGTAATMLAMVAFVGFLIHVFSLGYMADDKAKGRFFGGLSIFMFSMLGIILADNLIMIFVFWELVGFSSYMLIGHYLNTDEAAAASKKAFIVNRIGDLGFLVGIVYAYWHFGTTNLEAMSAAVAVDPGMINAAIAALLMCGFIGKSAQFPLHVWLPDAMAGPTPVSALIHAATMVAAGVYFLIRIAFLFPESVLGGIAILGTSVAVYAGFCAYGQNDIKKILAYSTLSQLGYMSAAFGLGFPGIALFHLITHAFFKALLFLGAGSIIHGCHHEQDIFKMGGIFKKMPITSITFVIGVLALCGVYGFAGFYSKDAILIAAGLDGKCLFILLTLGAFLTAGYMGRLVWIVFFGEPKSESASHAHESGATMLLPLIILAVLSVVGGWLHMWPEQLGQIIVSSKETLHHVAGYDAMHHTVLIWGSAAWIVGLLGSLVFYGKGATEDRLAKVCKPAYDFLKARLWFDEIYGFYVAKIQQRLAVLLSFLDIFLIKGVFVRGSAGLVGLVGACSRSLHVGNIHAYVYWFLGGIILLWAFASGVAL